MFYFTCNTYAKYRICGIYLKNVNSCILISYVNHLIFFQRLINLCQTKPYIEIIEGVESQFRPLENYWPYSGLINKNFFQKVVNSWSVKGGPDR